jgi:uncharacterized protein YacL
MQRNSSQTGQPGTSTITEIPRRNSNAANRHKTETLGTIWEQLAWRSCFIAACIAIGYHFHPFNLSRTWATVAGLGFGLVVFLIEMRLKRTSLRRLIGASVGTIIGVLAAYLMTLVLAHTSIPEAERSFIGMAVLLVMTYIGMIVGANKGDMLNLQAFGGVFGNDRMQQKALKILDTSVIIDGRIADVCDAHFIDGTLIVPAFVLRELQMVADSGDSLKRQRGRRGLEVIQRIQKMPHLDVEVVDEDFPQIAEVDLKLIELAKRHDCKIVTNDFNLNKVAGVHGIEILNVNQLANALKPVVLPGEPMRVFILREGKEYNQGVAYLDDGTMVVVDGARKMINKTIDINVTSVHQTTAGKMIFGRYDDRAERAEHSRLAASGTESARPEPVSRSAETIERAPRPVIPGPTVE